MHTIILNNGKINRLYKKLQEILQLENDLKKNYKQQIPAIPIRKESEINVENIKFLVEFFDIFFKRVINVAFNQKLVKEFFNIFPKKLGNGIIYCEVQLKKHSGGRYTQATCSKKIQNTCFRNWKNRWFTVTDQGVFYTLKKRTYLIKQMLNFCHNFKIYYGIEQTGEYLGIQLKSAYRALQLKAGNLLDFALFVITLKQSFQKSPHKDIHRYNSFSSIKEKCSTKYFIDGQDYFQSVRIQLLNAKKYVYITDWMITPFFHLKRPTSLDDRTSRLDYIFEELGKKGVKIYIILYMEPKIALNNDSQYVEKYFHEINTNIKVLRHPNYILIPFLWSHHQKIIVIDQKVAFLGGLDICYGRWDTQKHSLVDQKQQQKKIWKGADFCNFRISDIYKPRNFQQTNLNKKSQPRMPWHDICIQVQGGSVHDIARHFIQYWNFVNFQTKFDQRQLLMHAGIYQNQQKKQQKQKQDKQHKTWVGFSKIIDKIKDVITHNRPRNKSQLSQGMVKQIQLSQGTSNMSEKMSEDLTNKSIDENSMQIDFSKELSPADELIEGQFEYYEHYLQPQNKILPKIDKIQEKIKEIIDRKLHNDKNMDKRLIVTHQIQQNTIQKKGKSKHQILRSASTWSLGLEDSIPENSIHQAYIDLIKNSKYYIYIQNQFLISVQNKVCSSLVQRISKAYINKQKFKVIIFMPLLPGFEGNITNQKSSSVMRVQLHWQYRTLCRSKNSLFKRLQHIPNIDDYLKVYSLRQHGLTDAGIPVTEQIYIHSKLMIVDDEKVILGSANINDRSLLGDRDSEIAILVEPQIEEELMKDQNGKMYSESAKKLRVQLYKEHFGFKDKQCFDFHDQVTWKEMKINAKNNTEIYRHIFGCYPDDQMKTINDVEELQVDEPSKQVYLSEIKYVKGHVVDFPLKFLQKENLNLKINQRQFFIPFINFT